MMRQNLTWFFYVENVREGRVVFPEAGVNMLCLEERKEFGQLGFSPFWAETFCNVAGSSFSCLTRTIEVAAWTNRMHRGASLSCRLSSFSNRFSSKGLGQFWLCPPSCVAGGAKGHNLLSEHVAQPFLPFLAVFSSHLLPLPYHFCDTNIYFKHSNISSRRKKSFRIPSPSALVIASFLKNILEANFTLHAARVVDWAAVGCSQGWLK